MAEDAADRTEAATPKRREDARKRGEVAQSRDLSGVVLLAAGFALLGTSVGSGIAIALADLAQASWSGALVLPQSAMDYHGLFLHALEVGLRALATFVLALVAVGIASHVVQTGFLFSTEALAPKMSRLSPLSGLQRIFGSAGWVELAKAALKLAIVIGVTYLTLRPAAALLLGLANEGVASAVAATVALADRLAMRILGVLVVLALGDLGWQIWRHERRLRMSREEVREEVRQREGSPHVRSRQRAMARELSRARMIAAVAEADVVVVNPTHFAVALRYARTSMRAPKVVAKGRNFVALRIRRAAEEHGVPIVENPPLAQLLFKTARLDREIPDTLFQAVAEVLAHVYRLDPRRAAGWSARS